jgi:hypothetical protein
LLRSQGKTPVRNKKEGERFLGFTNYHRAFIEEYTQMAFSLQALTGKRTYQWGDEQEKAFDELRNAMVRAPEFTFFGLQF